MKIRKKKKDNNEKKTLLGDESKIDGHRNLPE